MPGDIVGLGTGLADVLALVARVPNTRGMSSGAAAQTWLEYVTKPAMEYAVGSTLGREYFNLYISWKNKIAGTIQLVVGYVNNHGRGGS